MFKSYTQCELRAVSKGSARDFSNPFLSAFLPFWATQPAYLGTKRPVPHPQAGINMVRSLSWDSIEQLETGGPAQCLHGTASLRSCTYLHASAGALIPTQPVGKVVGLSYTAPGFTAVPSRAGECV